MKTILLDMPATTFCGYGTHSRQLARYFLERYSATHKIYFNLLNWGNTPWIIDRDRFDGLIGKIMEHSSPLKEKADYQISLKLPNEFEVSFSKAHYNIGISAVVETDRCNPEWISSCNKCNLMIVPSNHCLQTLKNSGNLTVPTFVVPESFPDQMLLPRLIDKKENPFNFDTEFNFLIVGQLTSDNVFADRKNIFFTIKWLCELFNKDKDVGIILKTNYGRNTKLDKQFCTNMMRQLLMEVRKGLYPKLHFIHGDLYEDEMVSLYTHPTVKAFISAHRGEGFCIPMLEAAACGIPVISTNWSGHLDFMNKGKFIKLDYTMEDVHNSKIDRNIFMPGVRWAFPKEEDFKKKVKKFRESSDIPKEWAFELQKKIQEEYSFESIAKQYDGVFKDRII